MRIVVLTGTVAAIIVLTRFDKLNYFFFLHHVLLVHQKHCCKTPIYTTHSQILCYAILLRQNKKNYLNLECKMLEMGGSKK